MADPMLMYWDSVVFISYLTGQYPDRRRLVQTLIRHLESGKAQLVTSTFTIAEVRYYCDDPKAQGRNDPECEKVVDELFSNELVEFRAVTDFIARDALQIGRQFNDLTPGDSVHIASAADARVDHLFTWDGESVSGRRAPDKMLTYDGRLGDPPLSIVSPYDPWQTLGLSDGDVGVPTSLGLPSEPPRPSWRSPTAAQD